MKSRMEKRRDRRGREIEHLVPAMLEYVSGRGKPAETPGGGIRYSIREPEYRYSLRMEEDGDAVIRNMEAFRQDAEKDMALYDSRALENTYHAWEKENSAYKSFSSEVTRMVEQKFRKTSDFYRAAGIDKRTYHKIKSDFGYKPSRLTAFRCCIGLQLDVEEAEELLKLAGMAFSPNDPDDLVVKFCLENGIRDIPGINYMLYRYATRPLNEDSIIKDKESWTGK